MSADAPTQLIVGPDRHGVVQYARRIADAVALRRPSVEIVRVDDPGRARVFDRPAHVHFTDRLFGSSASEAAEAFERMARGASVSVTLHDLPQPSDGESSLARRSDSYRRVIDAAAAVAVGSAHERSLVAEFLDVELPAIEVIPLPVASRPSATARHASDGSIAVLGFIYPGKGHAEVIDAAVGTGSPVVALGAPSPGHERDVDALSARVVKRSVPFEVTGYLSDDDLIARCRASAVPVVALQHISASGSTATWIESGRKPLVPDSRYGREISVLRPGTITLYEPEALGAAITAALADPASTWLRSDATTRPHLDDTADAYLRWWARIWP